MENLAKLLLATWHFILCLCCCMSIQYICPNPKSRIKRLEDIWMQLIIKKIEENKYSDICICTNIIAFIVNCVITIEITLITHQEVKITSLIASKTNNADYFTRSLFSNPTNSCSFAKAVSSPTLVSDTFRLFLFFYFWKVRFIPSEFFHRKQPALLCDRPRSCDQADEEALTEDLLKMHI